MVETVLIIQFSISKPLGFKWMRIIKNTLVNVDVIECQGFCLKMPNQDLRVTGEMMN